MSDVQHDAAGHRFVAAFPEGKGELTYEKVGTDVIDLQHTRVDSMLRGRGVASELVKAAVTYARTHGLKIIPTCTYVAKWLEGHPAEKDLVR